MATATHNVCRRLLLRPDLPGHPPHCTTRQGPRHQLPLPLPLQNARKPTVPDPPAAWCGTGRENRPTAPFVGVRDYFFDLGGVEPRHRRIFAAQNATPRAIAKFIDSLPIDRRSITVGCACVGRNNLLPSFVVNSNPKVVQQVKGTPRSRCAFGAAVLYPSNLSGWGTDKVNHLFPDGPTIRGMTFRDKKTAATAPITGQTLP